MADKLTGKAGYITVNGATLYMTKVTPKVTRSLADSTDSADYNQSIDMLEPSQIPFMVGMELAVEGYYHLSQTTQVLLVMAYSGISAVPVVIGLNAGVRQGSGAFDLSDFASDNPINDTVKYTCSLKQNGPFTPGS